MSDSQHNYTKEQLRARHTLLLAVFFFTLAFLGFFALASLSTKTYQDLSEPAFDPTAVVTDPVFKVTPIKNYDQGFAIYPSENHDSGDPDTPDSTPAVSLEIYLYTCRQSELPSLKQNALRWLKEQNLDPSDYQITYSNC